ncbi:MAG: hypothetical protein ACFB6R_09750 [Alphaproteobacteria bacterium]
MDRIFRALNGEDPTRLWRRYALALGLILALACTPYTVVLNLLVKTKDDAAVVNPSGRQRMSIGIGIAIETDRPIDPAKLLVNADMALYRAKESGRGRFAFYSDALEQDVIRVKRLSDDILTGLEENPFVACYPPQVDAHTHEIVSPETLEHARILADLGCDRPQGYAFAPALSADEVTPFLAAQSIRKAS